MPFGKTLRLAEDGDVVFNESLNRHELVEGQAALMQDLKYRLLTVEEEDPIHPEVGIPYQRLPRGGFDKREVKTEFREEALADPRVSSVEKVTVSDPDENRNVEVTIEAVSVEEDSFVVSFLAALR